MMTRSMFGAAGMAAAGIAATLALASATGPAAAHEPARGGTDSAGERLGATIEQAIRAEGPFFNAEERATIERACGYPAGSWDGFEASMSGDAFLCSNGRRAESAEVRAVMETAGPRIGRRVAAAMARADVREAIDRVAREATAEAMRGLEAAEIGIEAAREAGAAAREAVEEARRSIEEAQRTRRAR